MGAFYYEGKRFIVKIGVTGSKGFLGKNLVEKLKNNNHKVIEFIGDIKNFEDVSRLYGSCEQIIHLAGKNRGNDDELFLTNALGAYNIYDCIKRFKIPTIVASSTYNKLSAYARSKHLLDTLMRELHSDFRVINYKMSNIVGCGCKPFYNSFISTLCYLEAKKESYADLIKDLNERITLIDIDTVTNDMIGCLEDDMSSVFYKHTSKGERWFSSKETINISFAEICEIFHSKEKSTNQNKGIFLKMIKEYEINLKAQQEV